MNGKEETLWKSVVTIWIKLARPLLCEECEHKFQTHSGIQCLLQVNDLTPFIMEL
jgi:hypothetical protein